jgi:hypothetical protein
LWNDNKQQQLNREITDVDVREWRGELKKKKKQPHPVSGTTLICSFKNFFIISFHLFFILKAKFTIPAAFPLL